MARVKIQITTPSNNVIKVSPGVSALSSVQLYLNELIDVNTQHGADGYVLTQQADGTFAMEAVATTLADLSDTNIPNPQGGDSLVYDADSQKWVPGGVKSVNGQEGDVIITIPSPPPTPGVSGLADTNITDLQDDQIIRYDSASGKWLNEDLEALPAGGTTGQALVKASNTDYDVTWDDIAVDVQFHQRYATEAETLRSGATETVELYFFAQGDGNGLAESASSDTPAAGYDIRRKLYYSEAGFADPDTGTWTQFTAIADNTTFNNAKAALLAYLKERTGGTVPISLKMTWEEVAQAPSFTGLLNESYGSGAEAAYSTRRLNGNVTDCMVIRRASDSTTQTIGFDGSGNIDEAAIETFCTGTTCTVYQWLDQSGNDNTATAAAPANEPTIYTGGALVKESGKVAVDFDGSNDVLTVWNNTTAPLAFQGMSDNLSILIVEKSDVINNASSAWFNGNTIAELRQNTTSGAKVPFSMGYSDSKFGFGVTDDYLSGDELELSATINVAQRLSSSFVNGDNLNVYLDGADAINTAFATATGDRSVGAGNSTLAIGARSRDNGAADANLFEGAIQELIIYPTNRSTNRTSIEENIGDYFTQNTPLLDTYSGAAAAYSLRLLDSTYTGPAIEVYAGTNGTADIYFNVFGELDTVALAAHCGNQDGTVRTWYDQSGNGNHATQTVSTANQPKIYDGTTGVITENGKPAVQFDGTGDQLIPPQFLDAVSANPKKYITTVLSKGVATNVRQPYDFMYKPSGTYDNLASLTIQGSTNEIVAKDWNSADSPTSQSSSAVMTQNQNLISHSYDLTAGARAHNAYLNSTLMTGAATGYASAAYNSISSAYSFIFHFDGKFQEIIAWNSDQSSNRSDIEDNINTFYSIY